MVHLSKNDHGPIPDYIVADEEHPGRLKCSKCGESISKLFADLGCSECDGQGLSSDYHTAKRDAEDAVDWIQSTRNSLTDDEKDRLKDYIKGELE